MEYDEKKLKNLNKGLKEGVIVTHFNRRISIIITKYLAKTNITPNQVTFISFFIILFSAYLFSTGLYKNLIIGAILLQFGYILDSVDGEIARLKNITSPRGAWLDAVIDRVIEIVLISSLCLGLYAQTKNPFIWIYGYIAISAILLTKIVIDSAAKYFGKEKLGEVHKKTLMMRICNRLKIKQKYVAITHDLEIFIIVLGALFNQLFLALMFFVVIQNLYWLAIVISIFIKKNKKTK